MIRAFVGRGGSGKTFAAVRYLWGRWKRGRAIYSTTPLIDLRVKFDKEKRMWLPVNAVSYGLDWADGYLNKISDVIDKDNCDVFLDELAAWLPAKDYNDIPPEFMRFLAQDRREGVDMVWTHRTFDGVIPEMRRNTAEVSRGMRFGPMIIQKVYDPDTPKDTATRVLFVSPKVYDLYQTLARVGDRNGEGGGLGKRTGYRFVGTDGREMVLLQNYGPHKISIYVRPEQYTCLLRKFGAEAMGVQRVDAPIPKYRESSGVCAWAGHATYDYLMKKRGHLGPGSVNHVRDQVSNEQPPQEPGFYVPA